MSDVAVTKDIEALERVLFRLASADDVRMLEVLQPLLPQLLKLFPRDLTAPLASQLKDKILQVITHVKTRLQALSSPRLPLQALGTVLQESDLSVFTHNFAFMFIEIGFRAATPDERSDVLSAIFPALATHSPSQQEIFFRLLLRALPLTGSAVYAPPARIDALHAAAPLIAGATDTSVSTTGAGADTMTTADTSNDMDPSIRDSMEALLDFLLDLQLYDGGTSTASRSAELPSSAVVYGLSLTRLERLQRVVTPLHWCRDEWLDAQMHAVRFTKELDVATRYKLAVFVAGSGAHHHSVKSFCDEQLVRVVKHEDAQLEDPTLVRRLVALVLGSHVAQSGGAFTGADSVVLNNRARLSDASILQALALLRESKAATRAMPLMLQLLCHVLFGVDSARPQNIAHRIALAGVRLCHWTFTHADAAVVEHLLAPVLLPTLLRVLMDPNANASAGTDAAIAVFTREFRQGIYEVLTVLGTRAPQVVAGSEQAFQVLLVQCLMDEERRSGTGANALKAFTALARAYGTHASEATRFHIRGELTDLLRGARLFDATKSYARVRAGVATWCSELLLLAPGVSESDLTMRFALLRLCGDTDAEVQSLATAALYKEPLPTLQAVATHLRAHYPVADLKTSLRDARTVESCLRFCLQVVKRSQSSDDMELADERRVVAEYFVQTLLGSSETAGAVGVTGTTGVSGDSAARSSMYEAAAASLVEISSFDADTLAAVLSDQVAPLLRVTCVSADRGFLRHIATLVQHTLAAEDFSGERAVREVVQAIALQLEDTALDVAHAARLQYPLGAAIAVLARSKTHELTAADTTALFAAYDRIVSLLTATVTTCSAFATFPRGEEDQNARIDALRSLLDGVGLVGSLIEFIRCRGGDGDDDSAGAAASDWMALKLQSLAELRRVVAWDLSGVSADGSLKLKLARLKAVAVDNLRHAVAGLPSTPAGSELTRLTPALAAALDVVLRLGSDPDPELQLLVGEALVTLGSHTASDITSGTTVAVAETPFAVNRAAAILSRLLTECAVSRQPTVRRSTATWLLCICAAGLSDTTTIESDALPQTAQTPTAWQTLLMADACTQLLVEIHEFFVTMLNDSNSVAKESAVKGLAYLRLRAPQRELGDQFSDSLFRRLRCFRAFVSPSQSAAVAGGATELDADSNVDMETPTLSDIPGAAGAGVLLGDAGAAGTTAAGTTVENAAYREVSNLAADIGDPELMYALLYLSTTDPIWQTLLDAPTTGSTDTSDPHALFSFAETDRAFRDSIVARAGRLWMDTSYASTGKLVPWLFLLKCHANNKVADVMASLWSFARGKFVTTSAQEKSLLQTHWHAIFAFLLGRLERSRNFRYREAACLALIELLNGVNAVQLQSEFLHLWRLAAAAVDDVMAPVGVVGLKLYRYMGELSLRLAASDNTSRHTLLTYLVSDGLVSKSVVCRTLAIDVLLRLVKALPASAIQDALAPLILKLLEYLSSLEMPELQYAQFHVQRKDQLERLRVSISQSGPVGQLLELATTRLKELAGSDVCVQIVDELTRGVANLLRFGVGLNTRVGSANFVATLAVELPFELRKCRGAELLLTRVFTPFVRSKAASENDVYGDDTSRYSAESGALPDGLVVQTYCRAAAYLCPLVDAPLVREYVRTGVFAFNRAKRAGAAVVSVDAMGEDMSSGNDEVTAMDTDSGSTSTPTLLLTKSIPDTTPEPEPTQIPTSTSGSGSDANRFLLITAIATKELVAKVPPVADTSTLVQADARNDWYCTHVFPGAFIGQFASTELLRSTWTAVLDELPPSVRYAEASIDATLAAIARSISHTAWGTRKQAVLALHALFASDGAASSYRSRITASQTARIWCSLLEAVPGRLWTGKGVILEALVALAGVTHSKSSGDGTNNDSQVHDLAALLLDECARAWRNRDMAYMESAVTSLGALSAQLSSPAHGELRLANFAALRRALLIWIDDPSGASSMQSQDTGTTAAPAATGDGDFALPPLMVKCVFEALAQTWPTAPLAATRELELTVSDAIAWLCDCATRAAFNVWSVRKAVFGALAAVVASAPASALTAPSSASTVLTVCCGDYGVRDAKYSMVRVAAAGVLTALTQRHGASQDLALLLTVHRERIIETLNVLRASEEPAEQRAAFATMTHLLQLE